METGITVEHDELLKIKAMLHAWCENVYSEDTVTEMKELSYQKYLSFLAEAKKAKTIQ